MSVTELKFLLLEKLSTLHLRSILGGLMCLLGPRIKAALLLLVL